MVADPAASAVVGTDAADTSRRVAEQFLPSAPAVAVGDKKSSSPAVPPLMAQ